MTRPSDRDADLGWRLWKGPSVVWLLLMATFLASVGWAYWSPGEHLGIKMMLAGLMIVLLVTFLMDLRNANALIRIVAAAGLFWTSIMFVLTFTDYLSRHY
jgi:caa(3)-type oxidase subunit IV